MARCCTGRDLKRGNFYEVVLDRRPSDSLPGPRSASPFTHRESGRKKPGSVRRVAPAINADRSLTRRLNAWFARTGGEFVALLRG